jgi:hypothetical protein
VRSEELSRWALSTRVSHHTSAPSSCCFAYYNFSLQYVFEVFIIMIGYLSVYLPWLMVESFCAVPCPGGRPAWIPRLICLLGLRSLRILENVCACFSARFNALRSFSDLAFGVGVRLKFQCGAAMRESVRVSQKSSYIVLCDKARHAIW